MEANERPTPNPVKKTGQAAQRRIGELRRIHPRLVELARKIDNVPAFLRSSEILFGDPRPRNSLGEYASDPGEGADPNQMAAAYGPPEVSETHIQRVKNFFLKRRQTQTAES